jgi:hypothetical protein
MQYRIGWYRIGSAGQATSSDRQRKRIRKGDARWLIYQNFLEKGKEL